MKHMGPYNNFKLYLQLVSQWRVTARKTDKEIRHLISSNKCTTHTDIICNEINIEFDDKGVKIKITNLLKTSAPGKHQASLSLPFFHTKPEICTALTLKGYVEKTQNLRNIDSKDKLLISYKKKK